MRLWQMIIVNNEEALRITCQDVSPNEVGDLIATLENELNNANRLGKSGIGLAAPQIGIGKNIAIIRLGEGMNLNLVNCKIEKGYDPAIFRNEGCLSFPGRVEDTMRYQEVHVVNNLVEPYSFIAAGFLAIACQHEIDHLNSTLFMDRSIPKAETNIKVGRNDLCPCNSGKKYKRCCG
jgi:peptide deformylase